VTAQTSADVRIWNVSRYKGKRATSYTVRWLVAGNKHQQTFATLKLAETFRTGLTVAARSGTPFVIATGLPATAQFIESANPTWLEHAMDYVGVKWPSASARHRKGIAEALTDVTTALLPRESSAPSEDRVRRILYSWAFNVTARTEPVPQDLEPALRWLRARSPLLSDVEGAATLRRVLDRLSLRQDGAAAAASTIARKRATLHNALEYAVELELMATNPLHKVRWKAPRVSDVVDNRVVVNPDQARRLLTAVWELDPALAGFSRASTTPRCDRARHATCDFRRARYPTRVGGDYSSPDPPRHPAQDGQTLAPSTRRAGSSTGRGKTPGPSPPILSLSPGFADISTPSDAGRTAGCS
jgi:hypothetical protein